jgi:hypothetical protein
MLADLMILLLPRILKERSDVAFTLNTYSHIIRGMQEDAMKLLDEISPKGITQIVNEKVLKS